MTIHTYATHLDWEGSTGAGNREYSRNHTAVARPADASIALSSDPAFRGDSTRVNPEQLLVLAASSCQLLSFLALAAQSSIDVLGYEDNASGVMDDRDEPARISRIALAPIIRVVSGVSHDEVMRLVERAHHECYIANTLNANVSIDATVIDV